MNPLMFATMLIVLHAVDGTEVMVNPEQITVLRPSREAQPGQANTLLVPGVRCAIGLTDGKYVTVVEECALVRRLMETNPRSK